MNLLERLIPAAIRARIAGVVAELLETLRTIKERGVKHFARPIAMSAVLTLAVYWFVYLPPIRRLELLHENIESISAGTKYAAQYSEMQARLQAVAGSNPGVKDKDSWWLDYVREAMKAENLNFTSFSPVTQEDQPGFTKLSLTIQGKGSYRQIASWMARLERSRYSLQVQSLDLRKLPNEIGINQVQATVVAAIPKESAR